MSTLVKKNYEHYVNKNINLDINLDKNLDKNLDIKYNIYVVYFINCMVNNNYMEWLINQINLVKDFGEIYIVATLYKNNEEKFRKDVLALFPKVGIECYYENEHEYRGILKVWELGRKFNNSNDIILYFHSKGVTRHRNYASTKDADYNIVLQDINKIKEIFTIFPSIDKVGFYSGGCGWLWVNFWYARGSYIYQVEKPLKTQRRHYYEDWLGRKVKPGDELCNTERDNTTYYENTLKNCYGFYTNKDNISNIGSYLDANTGKFHQIKN
jgi:hypothetical protein